MRRRQTHTLQAQDILQPVPNTLTGGPAWQPWHLVLAALHLTPPWNHGPVVHEQGFSGFVFVSNWEQNHPDRKSQRDPAASWSTAGLPKWVLHSNPHTAFPERLLLHAAYSHPHKPPVTFPPTEISLQDPSSTTWTPKSVSLEALITYPERHALPFLRTPSRDEALGCLRTVLLQY